MTSLPKIAPLVVTPRAAAFDNSDWIFELKYDGFRALLEIDGAVARLVSRNRNRFKHLDTLAAALAKRLRVTDAILDGEIICADETGRPIFIEMLRGHHPMCFVAFDLLWLNGEDLRALPLVERKVRLKRLLPRRSNHLIAEALAIEGRGAQSSPRSRSTILRASSPSAKPIPSARREVVEGVAPRLFAARGAARALQ